MTAAHSAKFLSRSPWLTLRMIAWRNACTCGEISDIVYYPFELVEAGEITTPGGESGNLWEEFAEIYGGCPRSHEWPRGEQSSTGETADRWIQQYNADE